MIVAKPDVRIGFVSGHAPDDVTAQSGIPWHIHRALERYCGSVEHFGPVRPWIARPLRFASRLSNRLSQRHRFIDTNSDVLSRAYGKMLTKRIATADVDWLFAPYASAELANLETTKPILYYSDTTFRSICDYYPNFSGLSDWSRRAGDDLERRAITRSAVACFASEWAASSAIRDYGTPAEKVHVLPMSANLIEPPTRESLRFNKVDGPVRLLFTGVDWQRKGGRIAFDTLTALLRRGMDAELTVVGCTVPMECSHQRVRSLGFVNKSTQSGKQALEQLLRDSDFLILPTRAECYGIVFVEAAAFALPSLATDTGGVRTALAGGASGYLLPTDATGEDYANRIADAFRDRAGYSALRMRARDAYDSSLSWSVWADRVNHLTEGYRR
jgi:glycosyltransferase involved in cell wall biosynthesis